MAHCLGDELIAEVLVYYLYGSKPGSSRKLVATFGSEQQLLAYVRWATLQQTPDKHLQVRAGERTCRVQSMGAQRHGPHVRGSDGGTA
jgi:hypothetical protein